MLDYIQRRRGLVLISVWYKCDVFKCLLQSNSPKLKQSAANCLINRLQTHRHTTGRLARWLTNRFYFNWWINGAAEMFYENSDDWCLEEKCGFITFKLLKTTWTEMFTELMRWEYFNIYKINCVELVTYLTKVLTELNPHKNLLMLQVEVAVWSYWDVRNVSADGAADRIIVWGKENQRSQLWTKWQ